MKTEKSNVKSWTQIKDDVYGKPGTTRRDELDRELDSFKIGLLIRQAREAKYKGLGGKVEITIKV